MKKTYISPKITDVKLDNDISLVLYSEQPDIGPGEELLGQQAPGYFNNNDTINS